MAGEIRTSVSLAVSKNGAVNTFSGAVSQDMTGDDIYQATQAFTTSESAVNLGPCAQAEYVAVRNLDSTNSLIFGQSNPITQPFTLKAGKVCLFPLIGGTLYAKSDRKSVV